MSRLQELTSRFELADATDAAAGNASTQTPAADAAEIPAPENAGDAGTPPGEGTAQGEGDSKDAAAAPTTAAPAAAASDQEPAWFSKALQREQIERANISKELKNLQEKIEARGGEATAAEARQVQSAAANLEASTQRLTKIKAALGKDFDAFEKGGEVLGDMAGVLEDQATQIAAQAKEIKDLRQRLDSGDARSQAQVQADQYWSKFDADNASIAGQGQKLWNESLQEATARGLKGDGAAGAAEVLWQMKVDAALEAAKQAPEPSTGSPAPKPKIPTAPARTPPVTPGAARVVQPGAGARTPATAKSPEKQIEDGDVDFGFKERYGRFNS